MINRESAKLNSDISLSVVSSGFGLVHFQRKKSSLVECVCVCASVVFSVPHHHHRKVTRKMENSI